MNGSADNNAGNFCSRGSGRADHHPDQCKAMTHPHPDKQHVVRQYRRYILAAKKSFGTARGLIHYRGLIQTYLQCKVAARLSGTEKGTK